MTRPQVRLRPVRETDLAGTEELWTQVCAAVPPGPSVPTVAAVLARVRARIVSSTAQTEQGRPETYALTVAQDEQDRPVGLVSVSVLDDSLLAGSRHAAIDALYVTPGQRRRGIGRDLLHDALEFASRLEIEQIAVQAPQHSRELNRFFADWGFAPGVVRRSTEVTALGWRMGVDLGAEPVAGTAALSHMQRLLRRRAVLVGRAGRPVRTAR